MEDIIIFRFGQGTTHLAFIDQTRALCGRDFALHKVTWGYEEPGRQVGCSVCKGVRAKLRDPESDVRVDEVEETKENLRVTTGGRRGVAKTHYTFDGKRSLCGTNISRLPIGRMDDVRPLATCIQCLGSPRCPDDYASEEARAALEKRGRYRRK